MPKVAVVTGGSAGVGRAAVRELAARGYDVAILARGEPGLEGAVADVTAAGRRGLGVSVDVADAAAVEAAAEQVERELGPIDVWVNNAFVGFLAPLEQVDVEAFHRVTEVTYHGQVHGTIAALKRMRPRDRGVIIQVGSALAFRGIPLQSAYCGAKHAIVGFTESVITELGHERSGIKVCMVHLPALNTPQFSWVLNKMPKHPMPVPPIYQPEVAGRAIAYVADHPRRTLWVGTPTALTILGNRVAPWLLDKYLARTGFDAQQDDKASVASMDRPNLYDAVPVDHGAHGIFDDRATRRRRVR
jgi:NAD(P)-dependent dehydrogenase (short-subunit alcohol dehydrogenase family)